MSTIWNQTCKRAGALPVLLLALLIFSACAAPALPADEASSLTPEAEQSAASPRPTLDELDATLPTLTPLASSAAAQIEIATTTNIIADIVAQVGGERVTVTALMPPGTDPHSYAPTPQDLRLLNEVDLILINGLALEESLLPLLNNLDRPVPIAAVNVGITVEDSDHDHDHEHEHADDHEHEHADDHEHEHADDHEHEHADDHEHEHADDHEHEHADDHEHEHADDHEHEHADDHEHEHADDHEHEHAHEQGDPHTWQSVRNVQIWVSNIATLLSALDPEHAALYAENAAAYNAVLDELDAEIREQVATIPPDARKLVTDHNTFAYYARDYGFEVIGAVIGGFSTVSAPSAQELAALQDQIRATGAGAIFVGNTVSMGLAQQISEDVGVPLVRLYSDSLSEAGGPAATYADFMRYNTAAIVEALSQ